MVAVDESIVDLVAHHQQIVTGRDLGQRDERLVRQHGTGRIAGVAQEKRLGARRDGRLDRGGIQREVVLHAGRHEDGHPAVEDHRRLIGHVRGVVQDDLVARIDDGRHGRRHGLGRADRHADLTLRVVIHLIQPRQVPRDGPTQFERAVVAGVVGAPRPKRPHALLDDLWWGREVRLADAQADDVGHRGDHVEEPPDP